MLCEQVYCLCDFARCFANCSLLVYQTHRLYEAIKQQEGPSLSVEQIDGDAPTNIVIGGTYLGNKWFESIGGPRTRTLEAKTPSTIGAKAEARSGEA